MTLETQILPISFFKGINTVTDDKNSVPGELLVLENAVFDKTGKLSKRNGFDSITRSATLGNISEGEALSSYNNELVLMTGQEVFGFSESENVWVGRGKDYSLSDKTTAIYSNDKQQQNPEAKILNDLELYVWEETSGGGVRYSLTDHLNGSVLVSSGIVDVFGSRPKIIVFKSKFVIIYYANGKLLSKIIDPATPFSISDTVILANSVNLYSPNFDVLSSEADGYFHVAFSSETEIGDGYGGRKTRLGYFTDANISSGTLYDYNRDSAGSINLWEDGTNLWLMTGSGNNQLGGDIKYPLKELWIAGIRAKSNGNQVNAGFKLYQQPKFTVYSTGIVNHIYKVFGYKNQVTGENIIHYELRYSSDNSNELTFNPDYGHVVYKAVVTLDGQIFRNDVFLRGIGLYSKPFRFKNDYFFLATTDTEFQATYYLLNSDGLVVSRSNVNQGGGYKTNSISQYKTLENINSFGVCTDAVVIDSELGMALIPLQVKTSIVSDNNTIYLPTGINKVNYAFNTQSLNSLTLANNLNISGGVFKSYDGFNLVENNFFQYPENVQANSSPFLTSIESHGTRTNQQVVLIESPSDYGAFRIAPGAYFTLGAIGSNYYFWFKKDGVGTDPLVPGLTGLAVDINSNDNAIGVYNAIANALPSSVFTSEIFFGVIVGLRITNAIAGIGTIADPTTGTMNSGAIETGNYLYSVTYEWLDSHGQIQRSGTSVAKSVTVDSTISGNVSIIVPTIKLTEKQNIKIVVYRTENDGEIFRRVSDLEPPIQNDPTADFVTLIDNKSDAEILSNDTQYTLGGVLDNSAPPSSTMCTLYRNRVFIGGLEDRNLLWFSKINSTGTPLEFSEFNTFRCDPRFGEITAINVLDDKLIIFKEDGIFYLTGNGPDNTGAQNDYNNGFNIISTEIGCIEPKSVVITKLGLMFKSKKGIYLLGRDTSTEYIGAPVDDYNDLSITSAIVNPNLNQVRFTTETGTMLVFDYFCGQWGTFTNLPAVDAHNIGSDYYLLKPNGVVYKENYSTYTDNGEFIKLKLQTGWFSFAKLQGFQRIRRFSVLGSYLGKHTLNLQFYYDFNNSPSQFTSIDAGVLIGDNDLWGSDPTWGDSELWGGEFVPYEFNVHLTQQKCTSIKILIEDTQLNNFNAGFDISNIAFEAGLKIGMNKLRVNNKFGNRT